MPAVRATVRALSSFAVSVCLLMAAARFAASAQGAPEPAKPFYLHDNDTVVFYGDSITEQRFYTGWVETYVATRFPHMAVHFFSVGVGGDRVTGGGGGPIDERLARDVFPLKPTVVTVMLGMNDGGYRPLTPEIEATYTQGYEHLLTSLEQTLPGVRITLLGASPYDEVTRPPTFPGGYNPTLVRFAEDDRELARKHNQTFTDLNAPFVASLKRGAAIDPLATELLLPDRVHPEATAHWLMAEALLKGWNAPSIVTATSIDAEKQAVVSATRSHVTGLAASASAVSWTELDDALPLPLSDKSASDQFLLRISDIEQDLDQQPLTVLGLAPGSYQLTIDGAAVGTFTASEFAQGVNLAVLSTPMRGQAYAVGWLIRDRDDAHYVRLRMLIHQMRFGTSAEPGAGNLLQFEQELEKRIVETAQPKPHAFQIKPVPVAAAGQ